MKHAEDNGEIEMFLDDSGELLYVCTNCKTKWMSKADPMGGSSQFGDVQIFSVIHQNPVLLYDSPLSKPLSMGDFKIGA